MSTMMMRPTGANSYMGKRALASCWFLLQG
jgi:hypothetical protein